MTHVILVVEDNERNLKLLRDVLDLQQRPPTERERRRQRARDRWTGARRERRLQGLGHAASSSSLSVSSAPISSGARPVRAKNTSSRLG